MSLRFKLTIGMGVVLFIISIILSVSSFELANRHFVSPINSTIKEYPPENESSNNSGIDESLNPIYMQEINLTDEITSILVIGREQFYIKTLFYMFFVTLFGCAMMYYILGKILNPLHKLTYQIGEIDEHELSQRIQTLKSTKEIDQLAQTFNHMIDRLEKSFTSQKRFTSDAAHELKTPLTVLRTNIEIMQLDQNPSIEEYKEVMIVVENQTNRMINLVENLFLASSLQLYEISDDVHYGTMFKQIVNDLMSKTEQMELTISTEIENHSIRGSLIMLTQAFSNLIENAIKYNHVGGNVCISVNRKPTYDVIKIEDTGIGLSESQLVHIFEPFYVGDKSRSRKVGGAGLGLAITKDIIEKHQGQILVASTVGVGTTFEVRLPYHN